jgi:S-(hydroxymethyl)mycothiol dehydrogenase
MQQVKAVVRIHACGVCHTDLHYREGGINDDFPFLLGHEDVLRSVVIFE